MTTILKGEDRMGDLIRKRWWQLGLNFQSKINNSVENICTILPPNGYFDNIKTICKIYEKNNNTLFILNAFEDSYPNINYVLCDIINLHKYIDKFHGLDIYMELTPYGYVDEINKYRIAWYDLSAGFENLKNPIESVEEYIDCLTHICKNNRVTIKWTEYTFGYIKS